MIQTPTVLVLGAGASNPYRFPLGSGLLNDVLAALPGGNYSSRSTSQQTAVDTLSSIFPHEDLTAFRIALEGTGKMSIDSFLARNSNRFKEIGKAAIAATLLGYEHYSLRRPSEGDWYREIYALMDSGLDIGKNKLTVVTYNYDRSFEEFLRRSLISDCGASEVQAGEAVKSLPILHLHGSLGPLPGMEPETIPFGAEANRHHVMRAAQRIKIIHEENVVQHPDFDRARAALAAAHRIYFLGFGYAHENLRRLLAAGLNSKQKQVLGTLRGLKEAEKIRLDAFLDSAGFKIEFVDADCCDFLRDRCFHML
ncbi:MAG TPA: SIR2 family protein [Verrucomicrobiae bacterium]